MKATKVAAVMAVIAGSLGVVASLRAINDDMKTFGGGSVSDQGRPAALSILRIAPVPSVSGTAPRNTDDTGNERPTKPTAGARERSAQRVAVADRNQRAAEAKAARAQEKADKLRKSLVDIQVKLLTDAARENNQPKIEAAKREILRLTAVQ